MPIYEHICQNCGAEHEFLMKVGASKKKCPDCGKNSLDKQMSTSLYHDLYSEMHPQKGRGRNGAGRVNPSGPGGAGA